MLKCQELKSLYSTSEFKEKYIDIEIPRGHIILHILR